MKKLIYISFLVSACLSYANAQTETTTLVKDSLVEQKTCYDSLVSLFNNKGVVENTVDGLYRVMITVRKDGKCSCMEGKIHVKKYKMELPILVKNDKGEFVTIASTGRSLDTIYDKTTLPVEFTIRNGRSPSYITNYGELGDIFFLELLKK